IVDEFAVMTACDLGVPLAADVIAETIRRQCTAFVLPIEIEPHDIQVVPYSIERDGIKARGKLLIDPFDPSLGDVAEQTMKDIGLERYAADFEWQLRALLQKRCVARHGNPTVFLQSAEDGSKEVDLMQFGLEMMNPSSHALYFGDQEKYISSIPKELRKTTFFRVGTEAVKWGDQISIASMYPIIIK
ncbi:hypothetical protein ADUPG1_011563, partial [Aduncisulcus paluster]